VIRSSTARTATLFGATTNLQSALAAAGYTIGAPACLMVNAETTPDLGAIAARCFAFADTLPAGEEGLIVTIMHPLPRGLAHWEASATTAGLLSFTRDAALAWAPRHIRVNMIQVHANVPEDDVADCLLVIVRLASMTGQMIALGTAA
jgi:NAD(P)-dependent dehydrogenase (short-subunit alcohol dehydrogenase family)